MTRVTYRLVENINPLYIINYIFFILRPCIQLPSHSQSLILSCLCLLFPITLKYIIVFMFLFITSHMIQYTLVIFHIHPYNPSDILQPLSIFLFLLHIKCIQMTRASLCPQVRKHIYNHRTFMSSFHSLLRENILPSPSVVLLHQHFHLQNFHFWAFFHSYRLFLPFCVI